MGGVQAVLSLALVSGPLLAGAAFDRVDAAAPYFAGAIFAALAALAIVPSSAKRHVAPQPEAGMQVVEEKGAPP